MMLLKYQKGQCKRIALSLIQIEKRKEHLPMELQIILNKINSLLAPIIIYASEDVVSLFTPDQAFLDTHKDILMLDDFMEQIEAFEQVGYEVTAVYSHDENEIDVN